MNMRHSALVVGLLGFLIVAVSVGAESPPTRSHEGPVDYAGLVKALSEAGATVKSEGQLLQPFFRPRISPAYTPVDHALLLIVDGQRVQVFEFLTPEDAETAATTIAPDGSSIGPTHVTWIDVPHFWKTGQLIVLYVGHDRDAIHVLERLLENGGGQVLQSHIKIAASLPRAAGTSPRAVCPRLPDGQLPAGRERAKDHFLPIY